MKNIALAIGMCFILSACGTTKPVIEQQNLLVKCDTLPDLEGTTGRDVLNTMTIWGNMYSVCQQRHSSLVDALK